VRTNHCSKNDQADRDCHIVFPVFYLMAKLAWTISPTRQAVRRATSSGWSCDVGLSSESDQSANIPDRQLRAKRRHSGDRSLNAYLAISRNRSRHGDPSIADGIYVRGPGLSAPHADLLDKEIKGARDVRIVDQNQDAVHRHTK
jgi:hypothetical protein